MNKNINIIVAETSSIIIEGLAGILSKAGLKYQILHASSLDEIAIIYAKRNCELIIINPVLIQNNSKAFQILKKQHFNVKWIGLLYAYYDQNLPSLFDSVIYISDTAEMITATIQKMMFAAPRKANNLEPVLTDREIDVLKLLTTGLANKEIADKLNISINTVITHRKNLTQKTGIKSVSGLTIYAVVQKLINI